MSVAERKNSNTLVVGTQFKIQNATNVDFNTHNNFQDYDLVLIDLRGALIGAGYDYTPRLSIPKNTLDLKNSGFDVFQATWYKTIGQIRKFLENGGTIFLIGANLPTVIHYDKRGDIDQWDLNKFIFSTNPITTLVGTQIQTMNVPGFSSFWDETKDIWKYEAVFNKDTGTPLAHVKGAPNQVIASFNENDNGGKIIIIPNIERAGENLLGAIENLTSRLKRQVINEVPEWAKSYKFEDEINLHTQIDTLNAEIKNKEIEKKKLIKQLNEVEQLKNLFTGTGNTFETIVEKVLVELGFKIEKGKDVKRVDRIGEYGDKIYAIEMQGINKGAKEDHARSLLAWIGEVSQLKDNDDVKGLLIVNAFKETPLEERSGLDSWPGKTLDICRKQNFCAITGVQLLGIYLKIQKEPQLKEALLKKIDDTAGKFDGFENYKEFLT